MAKEISHRIPRHFAIWRYASLNVQERRISARNGSTSLQTRNTNTTLQKAV